MYFYSLLAVRHNTSPDKASRGCVDDSQFSEPLPYHANQLTNIWLSYENNDILIFFLMSLYMFSLP